MIDEKLVNEEFDYNAEGELSDHLVSPGEKPKLSPNPDQSGYVKQVIVESFPESPERNVLYILNGVKYKWLVPEGWVRVFEQPNLYLKEGEHGTPVKENQKPKARPQIFSTPVVFQEDVLYKGKKLDELGGGTGSAPVFDADITEDSGKITVTMSEEDRNKIYRNKYPIIGIHIIDEEENDIVLYFKLRIASAEADAIVYDNWDGGDGEISQMELTFMWDGDDVKVIFETNEFSGGGSLEYATNNDIDALFNNTPEDIPVESIEFTNLPEEHSIDLEVGDVIDMSGYIEVSPSNATDKSYTLTTDAPSVLSINGTTITVLQGAEGTNANLTVTANDGSGCSDTMTVQVLDGEEPGEEIPIQSLRYTDGQGNTCVGFGMLKGEQVDLWTNLEITPSDATEGVEFMSDDDGIVQVDGTGVATATGEPGESTTITMSSMENPNIYTTIEISINIEDEEEEK